MFCRSYSFKWVSRGRTSCSPGGAGEDRKLVSNPEFITVTHGPVPRPRTAGVWHEARSAANRKAPPKPRHSHKRRIRRPNSRRLDAAVAAGRTGRSEEAAPPERGPARSKADSLAPMGLAALPCQGSIEISGNNLRVTRPHPTHYSGVVLPRFFFLRHLFFCSFCDSMTGKSNSGSQNAWGDRIRALRNVPPVLKFSGSPVQRSLPGD